MDCERDRDAMTIKTIATKGHNVPSAQRSAANEPDASARRDWRAYAKQCAAIRSARTTLAAKGSGVALVNCRVVILPPTSLPPLPPFPDHLRGLTCGARTRAGKPCKRTDLMSCGRCKLHGGASTGPKTPEGRQASLSNLTKRWARSEPHEDLRKADPETSIFGAEEH